MPDLIATSSQLPVGPGTTVRLHFSILLGSGEEVDTTRRGKPATFTFGDGNLLPGFEKALVGMCRGDDAQLEIQAADAFGERSVENIREMPKSSFDLESLEQGLIVSFASPSGELPGVLTDIRDDWVTVDFNHPLAGRDIVFDVTIVDVRPARGPG